MSGLLDFLQSASNTAASTVSGPVDLIGMLLRKAGVPVPQDSLGSSAWMKQKGLMQDVPQSAASLAGETFGLLSPVVAAAKAPQIAGGLLKMGENAAAPSMLGKMGQRGAIKFSDNVSEYAGMHRAPMKESGDPLHNVTKSVYPDDFYGPNGLRYYGTGNDAVDREAYSIMSRVKDRPNASVKMYRAVPHEPTAMEQIAKLEDMKAKFMRRGIVPEEFGGSRTSLGDGGKFYSWVTSELDRLRAAPVETPQKVKINNGDWVTTSRRYAKEHGESALGGKYKIISKTVPARKLFTNGDSLAEFGYDESGKAMLGLLGLLGAGAGGLIYAGQKD